MSPLTHATSLILLLAALIAPILYVVLGVPSGDFLDNVMSGLLSTVAALVGGIPIALWLDRTIKAGEDQRLQASERKREIELLELLREELNFSRNGLLHRRANPAVLQIQPLKCDLWTAVSSAGKVNLIKNHLLLNRITSAYYVISLVRRIEEQAYRAARSATVTFTNGQNAVQWLWNDARQFDGLLDASIHEAIRDIDQETGHADSGQPEPLTPPGSL